MIPASEARDEIRIALDVLRGLFSAWEAQAREPGLSGSELFVLQQLSSTKAISNRELAKRCHANQADCSPVLASLAERSLAVKGKALGESQQIQWRLTPQGHAILQGREMALQARLLLALNRLGTLERRGLCRGLERLWEEAYPKEGEAPPGTLGLI